MIVARAPLRIPLGGGGTDFPSYYLKYSGYILGFALGRYVHVILNDTIDKKIRLKYSKTEVVDNVDMLENRVAAEALKWYGVTEGIEIVTFSDVPEGSGLGGSSSFCVALVTALRMKLGIPLNRREIFASAYDIERNKAGQPGGMQDQYLAAFGGAWELRLRSKFDCERVEVAELLPKLSLVYTNTGRSDLSIAKRQIEKADDRLLVDNLDTIKSIGMSIRSALLTGHCDYIGRTFHQHWLVKKERDPSISNPEVDRIYEIARSQGALGGKLLGLGGGGYLLLYSSKKLEGLDCLPVTLDTQGCKVVYRNGG